MRSRLSVTALLVAVAYGAVAWRCIEEQRYVLIVVFSLAANFLFHASTEFKFWPQQHREK